MNDHPAIKTLEAQVAVYKMKLCEQEGRMQAIREQLGYLEQAAVILKKLQAVGDGPLTERVRHEIQTAAKEVVAALVDGVDASGARRAAKTEMLEE